jgi:hypothetical protein
MTLAVQTGQDLSLAEHPFVARLSRLMHLGDADVRSLELIVQSERTIKKRGDLIIVGDQYRKLCFVKDGFAIRYKLLRTGKR